MSKTLFLVIIILSIKATIAHTSGDAFPSFDDRQRSIAYRVQQIETEKQRIVQTTIGTRFMLLWDYEEVFRTNQLVRYNDLCHTFLRPDGTPYGYTEEVSFDGVKVLFKKQVLQGGNKSSFLDALRKAETRYEPLKQRLIQRHSQVLFEEYERWKKYHNEEARYRRLYTGYEPWVHYSLFIILGEVADADKAEFIETVYSLRDAILFIKHKAALVTAVSPPQQVTG